MGEKKQKEARMKRVKQILIVLACVLFVVLMILSGMGSHWITSFKTVKPGDSVVVDYTLYDSAGNPILTSDQQRAAKGNIIYTYQRLTLAAGQDPVKSMYPVPIYTGSSETTTQFAILPTEYAAINQAIIGMKSGDQKRVQIPESSEPRLWDAATIAQSGLNVSQISVGELIPMALSDNPEAMASNSSSTYLRIGRITGISGDGIVVDVNYPAADISIVSINAKS
jgi:FKBP-type peptidyl-prolyl cis-trans isomerase 2